MAGDGAYPELRRERLTGLRVRIGDGNEMRARCLRVFLRVKPAEIAHADDSGAKFLRQVDCPPGPQKAAAHTDRLSLPAMSSPSPTPAIAQPRSPIGRELAFLLAALGAGLILVPWLIWGVGELTLGTYGHGGPFALWGDYLRGLLAGSPAFWIVFMGPYALLLTGRVLWRLMRRS